MDLWQTIRLIRKSLHWHLLKGFAEPCTLQPPNLTEGAKKIWDEFVVYYEENLGQHRHFGDRERVHWHNYWMSKQLEALKTALEDCAKLCTFLSMP